MNSNKKELSKRDFLDLKHILKQYANWYKALYHFNPANAEEFQKNKNFFLIKEENHQNHIRKNIQIVNMYLKWKLNFTYQKKI